MNVKLNIDKFVNEYLKNNIQIHANTPEALMESLAKEIKVEYVTANDSGLAAIMGVPVVFNKLIPENMGLIVKNWGTPGQEIISILDFRPGENNG